MSWLEDLARRVYGQAQGAVQKAGERDVASNALDALKGSAAGFLTGAVGAPADYLSMIPLSSKEGGNPYAGAIRNVLGNPEKPFMGSQYLADKIGLGGEGLAYGVGQMISPAAIKDLMKGGMREITTYHASPYKFEPTEKNPLGEFDLSKIGTGEGAQAYGHGSYVAQSPEVAKEYAKQLGGYNFAFNTPEAQKKFDEIYNLGSGSARNAKEIITDARTPEEAAIHLRDYAKTVPEGPNKTFYNVIADMVEKGEVNVEPGGYIYSVDLPDEHIANMLDWDELTSEQGPKVAELAKLWGIKGILGDDFYRVVKSRIGNSAKGAAQSLRERGIPGIKYSDSMSRGQGGGTKNFAVFDPSILTILSREKP